MRYRRYYVNPNRGNGNAVVSTGPFVAFYVLLGKVILLGFPLALTEWIHGVAAWLLIAPLEAAWLAVIWGLRRTIH